MISICFLVIGTLVTLGMGLGTCPNGDTIFEQQSGKMVIDKIGGLVNRERQKNNAKHTGNNVQNVGFNEVQGKEALDFSNNCNIDYLLQNKKEGSDKYNVSYVSNDHKCFFWQVSNQKDCTADWENIISHFYVISDWSDIDRKGLCEHAQLNAIGCSFTCFESNLNKKDGKKMYVSLYNCVYGTSCDAPLYKPHVSENGCKDVCVA